MIRFLKLCWLLSRVYPWTSAAPWTHQHAEMMEHFKEGALGKYLAIHLRNCSLEINARAVQSGDPHQCDRAAGFLMALTYIDTLSLSASKGEPQSPDDEDSSEEPEEFLARMAP